METHLNQPVVFIEQLIEQLRNYLLKWNTTRLTGKIVITFRETTVPDIEYHHSISSPHSLLCPTMKFNQRSMPLHQGFSGNREHFFQSCENSSDTYFHKSSGHPRDNVRPGCCYQNDLVECEKGNSVHSFDGYSDDPATRIRNPELRESQLHFANADQTVSSQYSSSMQFTPSNTQHTSSQFINASLLPPFENMMPTENSHPFQGSLTNSEDLKFYEQGSESDIQTLPQTCYNTCSTTSQNVARAELSQVATYSVTIKKTIESHHSAISNSGDGHYNVHHERRASKFDSNNSSTTLNRRILDDGPPVSGSHDLVPIKKKMESWLDNDNRTENIASKRENRSCDPDSNRLIPDMENLDSNVSSFDLTRLSRSELINVVLKVLQREDFDRQVKSVPLPEDRVMAADELPALPAKDKMDKEDYSIHEFSTPDNSVVKSHPLLSEQTNGKLANDLDQTDVREVNSIYKLKTRSREADMKVSIEMNAPSATIQFSNESISSQNIKPLKKRTRLCANFKGEFSKDSHKLEGPAEPVASEKIMHPSTFNQEKVDSFNPTERVPIKTRKGLKKCSLNCRICGSNFSSRQDYRQHLRSHEGSFKCNVCGKVMKTKDSLYQHQRGLHSKEKPHRCKDCGISFNFYHSYKLHLLRHRGERPHKCKYCPKSYVTLYHLKEHMQAIHSSTSIICHVCGKKFSYASTLRNHLRRHSGEMPHKCSLCEKRFYTKQALKIHAISHTKDRNFQCETCGKCFKSEYSRNFHSKKHKRLLKRFMCDVCGKTFLYKCFLDSHVQIHSKLRSHFCNICNKAFKSKASVYAHKTNVHKEGLALSCSICAKSFKSKNLLSSHIKRHQNDSIFTCATCGANFPDKGGLTKHIRTVHLPQKCFFCKICGKMGTRADNMRTHVKKHKKEVLASNNPMDFIIEETATDTITDFQHQTVKIKQRSREPKHRSSRKLFPNPQAPTQNRWIQPFPTEYKDVTNNNTDLRSISSSSIAPPIPSLSQRSTARSHNDLLANNDPGVRVFTQQPKEFEAYDQLPAALNDYSNNKAPQSQYINHCYQLDVPNNSSLNNASSNLHGFPSGPLTTLLSSINTQEQEATPPPPYSFVISTHQPHPPLHHQPIHHQPIHHSHSYQPGMGNLHLPETAVQRQVESLGVPSFEMSQEKRMTTLQNVTLGMPPTPIEEPHMISALDSVHGPL